MTLDSLCDKRVTIDEGAQVSDGAGGFVTEWRPRHANVPARIRPMTAAERAKWGGQPVVATHVVYLPDVTLTVTERDRIRWGERVFNVLGLTDPHELGRHLRLECEEVR